MKKSYLFFLFITLSLINQARAVIVGMSWYQYVEDGNAQASERPDIILLYDNHKDHLVPEEAIEQVAQMEKFLVFLKGIADTGRPVLFSSEGPELQREQFEREQIFPVRANAVVLHVPTIDSIKYGQQQNNFKHTWFDLRDEKRDYPWCEQFKENPDALIDLHAMKACTILSEAECLSPRMRMYIDKYIKDATMLAKSPKHPLYESGLMFSLALDTDINLACNMYRQAISEDKPLQVGYGGLAHMKPVELALGADNNVRIKLLKTFGTVKIGKHPEDYVPPRLTTFYAQIQQAFGVVE